MRVITSMGTAGSVLPVSSQSPGAKPSLGAQPSFHQPVQALQGCVLCAQDTFHKGSAPDRGRESPVSPERG